MTPRPIGGLLQKNVAEQYRCRVLKAPYGAMWEDKMLDVTKKRCRTRTLSAREEPGAAATPDRPRLPGRRRARRLPGGRLSGLHEAGIEPDWIIGTSIGAINASLIAGNEPENRLARLKEFWGRMSAQRILAGLSAWPELSDTTVLLVHTCSAAFPASSSPIRSHFWGAHYPLGSGPRQLLFDRAARKDVDRARRLSHSSSAARRG